MNPIVSVRYLGKCRHFLRVRYSQIGWCKALFPEKEGELNTRKDKTRKLYLNILEQLVKDEYSKNGLQFLTTLLNDKTFLVAVAALAIEVPYSDQVEAFIRDDQSIFFERILEACSLKAYDVWRVLVGFVRLCSDMPTLMKLHLYSLEMLCFYELFWRERSPLVELLKSQATSSLIDHRREKRLKESKTPSEEKENIQPTNLSNEANSISISHSVNSN